MDTESFLLKRQVVLARLQARRDNDLSDYPFRMVRDIGLPLPLWSRWLLSLIPRRGLVSHSFGLLLPLVAPYLWRRQKSFLRRLFDLLISSQS
jgi:hypothetical protein